MGDRPAEDIDPVGQIGPVGKRTQARERQAAEPYGRIPGCDRRDNPFPRRSQDGPFDKTKAHGKPGGPQPGLVAKPYTLNDARDRLAEVSGDRAFAEDFFTRFVHGREIPDYAKLLEPAGIVVRKRNAGAAWSGLQMDRENAATVGSLVAFGTPAFAAGIEAGDVITSVGGTAFTTLAAALKDRRPGESVAIEFRRPSGEVVKSTMTLGEDPGWQAATVESAGGPLTEAQKTFREAWVGSRVK